MELDLTAEQRKFRDDLREYFADMMTDVLASELSAGMGEGGGPEYCKAMQRMGRDGLLGISWPREYGGQERSAVEGDHSVSRASVCAFNVRRDEHTFAQRLGGFLRWSAAGFGFAVVGHDAPLPHRWTE